MGRHRRRFGAWLVLWGFLAAVAPAGGTKLDQRIEALPQVHREWVRDVRPLLSTEELKEFLALEKDYQRDAFVQSFWEARDPYPETQHNEFRDAWEKRLEYVRAEYPEPYDARRDMMLLNGEPVIWERYDCQEALIYPLELWGYPETEQFPHDVFLLFYQPGQLGPYKLYHPNEGLKVLFAEPWKFLEDRCQDMSTPMDLRPARDPNPDLRPPGLGEDVSFRCALELLVRYCDDNDPDSLLVDALRRLRLEERHGSFDKVADRLRSRPDPEESEWLSTFHAYSTDLPGGAKTFPADLEIDFAGRRQSRTVVEGTFAVPAEELETVELAGERSYDLILLGEVLRGDDLLESFRYEVHVPAGPSHGPEPGERTVPVSFQRTLRPGDYRLVVKLEDVHSGKLHRTERELTVPRVEASWVPPEVEDPVAESLLAEAVERLGGGEEPELRFVPPGQGPHTGMVRFDTVGSPEGIDKVRFFLNGREVMARNRPPYGVELDLGPVPRMHTVRLEAFGDDGEPVASDELTVNAGVHSFRVRLLEPQPERSYAETAPVRAELEVPRDHALDRLEIWVAETKHATLYQPPFRQRVPIPGGPTYVRAVAYLEDGRQVEDMAWVNAPGVFEEVDVDLVEVYAAVTDRTGRMLEDLTAEDFTVLENGTPQEIQRFERVEDRPLWIMALFDTSASMEGRLEATRSAAVGFFEQVLTPKDRAALLTFHDRPRLRADFTHDVTDLAVELAGVKAERGTALYDAVITGLYAMNGLEGQRALLLLSDGKDESSRRSFDEALSYAKTAGVTIYAIGLDFKVTDFEARRHLTQLAEQTGGRSFFVDAPENLPEVYEQIERELRSRVLLVYASSNEGEDFRAVEVKVNRSGAEVQALRGYFP